MIIHQLKSDALNWPGPAVGLLIVMNPAAPWYLI